MATPHTVKTLDELLRSSEIGMYRHYAAARRSKRLERLVSISQIVINVLLSSVFLYAIAEELSSFAKWVGATLALIVAAMAGLESQLGFSRAYEQHHFIANKYRAIARTIDEVRAKHDDNLIALSDMASELTDLRKQYDVITQEGEGFITRQSDYRKAVAKQSGRQRRLAQQVPEQTIGPERGSRVSELID